MLQMALLNIFRCAYAVMHFVFNWYNFTTFRCAKTCTPQHHFRCVMVCYDAIELAHLKRQGVCILDWQVFGFLEGQILWFFAIVIFTVFWDFTHFLRNAMSESAEISRVGLLILAQWLVKYDGFVKFEEQFNKSENFNDECYFKTF